MAQGFSAVSTGFSTGYGENVENYQHGIFISLRSFQARKISFAYTAKKGGFFMKRLLLELFEDCLSREYREVENAANYSYGREPVDGGERLLIFFQHSHGVTDWMNNLDFSARPYEEMDPVWNCHAGFLRVWKSVRGYLKPHIFDPNIKSAVVVGYSHGAALATLCHEYIWYHRPDLREHLFGVGFGSPRVLHGCFPPEIAARWEQFYVVRNENDPITHLPPRFTGYCHVGNLITLGDPRARADLDSHRPEGYLAALKALAAQE